MKSKSTSFDIAHMAGVSQSTVSRALNDSTLVNAETREKVKRIAAELNYKVDKNASNLRKQQSSTLALLLFEDATSDGSSINPFFIRMLGSITKATAAAGYDLLVSFQNMGDDWHAVYKDCNKADGLILLGYGNFTDYECKLTQLEQQQTRFLRWGAPDDKHPGNSIGSDNYQGAVMITKHLLTLGKRHFAFIGGCGIDAPEFKERYEGFLHALAQEGLPSDNVMQVDAISTETAGFDAANKILAHQQPDAIVCASDLMAVGAIRAIKAKGLHVPNDIAVTGYDNIQISEFCSPAITTVKQNTSLAGELLVSNLVKLINNESVDDVLMQPELIVRKSCGINGS